MWDMRETGSGPDMRSGPCCTCWVCDTRAAGPVRGAVTAGPGTVLDAAGGVARMPPRILPPLGEAMSEDRIEHRRRALVIFEAVVELPPEERRSRLDAACAGDAGLRAQVEALLAADASEGEPFSGDGAQWSDALGAASAPAGGGDAMLGRSIGPWRIVGVLGRGGMGAVYAVERADGAYVQQAALKSWSQDMAGNYAKAQQTVFERAKANGLAALGQWGG